MEMTDFELEHRNINLTKVGSSTKNGSSLRRKKPVIFPSQLLVYAFKMGQGFHS